MWTEKERNIRYPTNTNSMSAFIGRYLFDIFENCIFEKMKRKERC